jgi:hypothetical protein
MLMKSKALTISLLLTAFWVLPTLGQWQIGGIRVADVPNAVQWFPDVVQDGQGGFIICWQDSRNGTWDIYAQRVDSSGYLLWGDEGVPVADGPATQDWPVMASDGQGGAIIAWEQPAASDIYAQRIDSEGQKLWGDEGILVCGAPDYQGWLDITEDGQGGAIMAWEDERTPGNGADIYAQRVDGFGNALWREDGFPACSLETNQFYPHLISDGDGGAVIGWEDGRDWAKIYLQKADAAGSPLWPRNGVPNCVDCITDFLGDGYSMATDMQGGVIIFWADFTDNRPRTDVYAGRVNSRGRIAWEPRGIPISVTPDYDGSPFVLSDSAFGAVLIWNDGRDSTFIQRLDSAGQKWWPECGRPVYVGRAAVESLTRTGPGGFASVLNLSLPDSSYGVKFDTTGAVLWDSSGVAFVGEYHGSDSYAAAADGKGGLTISWDSFYDGYVYAQRIYANGKVGGDTTTAVEDYAESRYPLNFQLLQNCPNPFNSTTIISFYLPEASSEVVLKVLNLYGQEVRRFNLGQLQKGRHRITWDGKDQDGRLVSSGIYLYSLTSSSSTQVRRMVLLK